MGGGFVANTYYRRRPAGTPITTDCPQGPRAILGAERIAMRQTRDPSTAQAISEREERLKSRRWSPK